MLASSLSRFQTIVNMMKVVGGIMQLHYKTRENIVGATRDLLWLRYKNIQLKEK